jgi:hypothetical protein
MPTEIELGMYVLVFWILDIPLWYTNYKVTDFLLTFQLGLIVFLWLRLTAVTFTYIHLHICIKICVCDVLNPEDKKRTYSHEYLYFGYRQ